LILSRKKKRVTEEIHSIFIHALLFWFLFRNFSLLLWREPDSFCNDSLSLLLQFFASITPCDLCLNITFVWEWETFGIWTFEFSIFLF
jgi:hypothetical protein